MGSEQLKRVLIKVDVAGKERGKAVVEI